MMKLNDLFIHYSDSNLIFQRQQQLAELKNKSVTEEEFRQNSIKDHEQAIQRHKEAINEISK